MKLYVITLGYASGEAWSICCESIYRTKNPDTKWEHFFLNQHYPLNKEKNAIELKEICDQYGIKWIDAGKNLGLAKGFNWALEKCGAGNDDLILGVDPDNLLISAGWDLALVRAVLGGKNVGWSSLWNTMSSIEFYENKKPYTEEIIDGYLRAWVVSQPVVNSVCCWRVSDLKRFKGLSEPHKFYGGLEVQMFPKFQAAGLRWAVLPDFQEGHPIKLPQDHDYILWKWHHAHTGEAKDVDFETWLKNRTLTMPNLTEVYRT